LNGYYGNLPLLTGSSKFPIGRWSGQRDRTDRGAYVANNAVRRNLPELINHTHAALQDPQ